MAMTITEKVLAAHSDKNRVIPGDLIDAKVDMALANDITAPLAFKVFDEIGKGRVFDKEKIALVPDHFTPNKDIASAMQAKLMRVFAHKHQIKHYFEQGQAGIEHVILPEKGLVVPGDLIVGADSHTVTYGALGAFACGVGSTDLGAAMATGKIWLKVPATIKVCFEGTLQPWVGGKDLILYLLGQLGEEGGNYRALEFYGPVIEQLSMEGRLTMSNMAIEGGAKNGIIVPDDVTRAYIDGRTEREAIFYTNDADAVYEKVIRINVDQIAPQVAFPHSPCNVRSVDTGKDILLDQAFIGSCTNGRIEDLRQAAQVLKGRSVFDGLRLIVIPGSPLVYRQALKEGLLETFLDAGAVIGPPSCGPCLGGHLGLLAEGEKCISTTNRNFIGRMGHAGSEVYLANPAVAAASAVKGRIAGPAEL